jgi:hypothetical protein
MGAYEYSGGQPVDEISPAAPTALRVR